ncbi:HD domain-containing protein [Dyadobacter sp. CY343]|uniref:HD domain-containing protein n=1 Tax=Dyadobacter sp. CY343 TaxID=2907299 RepID=UPI001F20D7CA|nr:HD domain-containing protein [Dyadobacter sp. CY343]MCE7060219.1 HD domain-containing protein [Dyadobacter sp. CY343]
MNYPNAVIEELMQDFRQTIGNDFVKYRNHVYRVFLNCILLDEAPENAEKYAIAAVFHDIGIWTDHSIDYLRPSIIEMRHYLTARGKAGLADEISSMIYWHHKVSRYRGKFELSTEVFRRADWADITFGVIAFGLDSRKLLHNRKMLPNNGFHIFLAKKLVTNFFKNPLKPLPMFTK